MVFSSFSFLWIFLPLVFGGAFLFRRKGSNLFLLAASLLFYAWGEPKYIVLLLLSISVNWMGGLVYTIKDHHGLKKAAAVFVILFDLGLLGIFKYSAFFTETINQLAGSGLLKIRKFALPIGISFYTFQAISYMVDLYRGKIKVQRSWIKLALYISFFPQLVAGPIVKYTDIEKELDEREIRLDEAAKGFRRFCFGLAKKVLIANTLGYVVDQILGHDVNSLSTALCWAAALFYTLQIYFDFSGYSDMAIGLASALGFHFQENFNYPYLSLSIREFWRRWHISLSTWFRDYLYIPLGGNRKGSGRTLLNLLIVFFATGLWHGAQWNFVFWGLYHGMLILLERIGLSRLLDRLPRFFAGVYAFLAALIGWVFFRAESITMAFVQLRRMAGIGGFPGSWTLAESVSPSDWGICLIGMILALGGLPKLRNLKVKTGISDTLWTAAGSVWALFLLFLSVVMLANAAHNPFIYFRF